MPASPNPSLEGLHRRRPTGLLRDECIGMLFSRPAELSCTFENQILVLIIRLPIRLIPGIGAK